jgi:hypothetical protein
MNGLPVLSYQNSVNPPVTLGIAASYFNKMHYLVRTLPTENPNVTRVMRSYVPIGDVTYVSPNTYIASRNGESYAYPTFGEAIADIMVRTS